MTDAPPKTKVSKTDASGGADGKKRFEVKKVMIPHRTAYSLIWTLTTQKWNAVALWAWDIVVDNCAICRNHIMDLCKALFVFHSCHSLTDSRHRLSSQPSICNERGMYRRLGNLQCMCTVLNSEWILLTMFCSTLSTFTASQDGSRPAKSAHWTTETGSSKNTAGSVILYKTHEPKGRGHARRAFQTLGTYTSKVRLRSAKPAYDETTMHGKGTLYLGEQACDSSRATRPAMRENR